MVFDLFRKTKLILTPASEEQGRDWFSRNMVNILLLAGFALCLLQVWLPTYYLTGDGPCHLYNAQIVHDIWCGSDTALYSRFYTLVYTPDPNGLTTFALALLLFIAKGAIAEKIFLTLYLLLYMSGFYLLLKKLGGISSYWLLAIFIFVFPLTLSKGFYNYSLSIAFWFWMVWAWLRLLERRSAANVLMFLLFTTLIYFTHLLPFVFGAFTCGALAASYAIAKHSGGNEKPLGFFLKQTGLLLLLLAPFLVLMAMFTGREGGLQLQLHAHPYRLIELAQFKYIITLVNTEKIPAAIAGGALLILFILAGAGSVRGFKVHKYDGLIAALLFVSFVYLFFPEDFMGRAIIISIRVQLFVFILIACILAYRLPEGNIKYAGAFLLFICFTSLSYSRIRAREKASAALAEHLFVSNLIPPGSVVLPLSFSTEGRDAQGNMIADRNSVFQHATHYLGLEQPLILLDNYEANMGYFPIRWKESLNPYNHLSTAQGIEGMPPSASLAAYTKTSGVTIDYILMWCYDPAFLSDAHLRELYKEINAGYKLVYSSVGRRTTLYQRK